MVGDKGLLYSNSVKDLLHFQDAFFTSDTSQVENLRQFLPGTNKRKKNVLVTEAIHGLPATFLFMSYYTPHSVKVGNDKIISTDTHTNLVLVH